MAEALMDRLRWTGDLALSAANAFGTVCVLARVYAHRADLRAAPTARAARFFQRNPVEAHPVEKAVECAQRTEIAAERPRDQDRRENDQHQHRKFPAEERACQRTQRRVRRHKRQRTAKRSRWTEKFAEKRRRHTLLYSHQRRQEDHQERQHHILAPA